jgi:hypothetical protein
MGFPDAWLDIHTSDTDLHGITHSDSSPIKFIACRRTLATTPTTSTTTTSTTATATGWASAAELDLITHFARTCTHFAWSVMAGFDRLHA